MKQVEKMFSNNVFFLTEEDISKMDEYDNSGAINNVLTGIAKQVYSIRLIEDTNNDVIFELFYIEQKDWKTSGYCLNVNLKWKNWDNVIFYFSRFLGQEYDGLDIVNTYNTFLSHTRTMLEKINFFTYTSEDVKKIAPNKESITMMVKNKRNIIKIPFIEKETILETIFGQKKEYNQNDKNKVYLMFNKRNQLTKIGISKTPRKREKTLQGEEPELFLAAVWEAPKKVEKELHHKFSKKRKRGEWFDLRIKDWHIINEYMSKYKRKLESNS